MRLALAAVTIVMQCGIHDINYEMKMTESHLRVSLPGNGFSGTKKAFVRQLRSSKHEPTKINKKHKEVGAEERIYNAKVNNSIFKAKAEGSKRRILLQSDTALAEQQLQQILKNAVNGSRTKRQAWKMAGLWQNGVSYQFKTSDKNVKKAFRMGAYVWTDFTCVDFVENNRANDKVVVTESGESWADVGRVGGKQYLSLEKNGTVGAAVHEIGHVLGLLHTMARYDRDNYININWENVDPLEVNEFEKLNADEVDVYGLIYDYGSIMQYDETSASVNDQPTMIARNPYYQKTMGSDIVSFSDVFTVNMLYGCNARCNKSTSAKCANEGFPHPRNCSICICPSGYGGRFCGGRPPGCGKYLLSRSTKRRVVCTLYNLSDVFDFCNYMILAPKGKKIQIKARLLSDNMEVPGCSMGGVEIKAQKDQKMTGYRFCSSKGPDKPILSSYSHLPVIVYNRHGLMEATFTYRYVD